MSISIALRAPEGQKSEFLGASSLFSISMGVDKILMQGDCLEKTIDIINITFGRCDIVISDALQRFNLMSLYPELSEDKAIDMAIAIGDSWLEKNQDILSNLVIPHQIFRWSDWLSAHHYQEKYKFVCNLFEHNSEFKKVVKASTRKYFERKAKQEDVSLKDVYLKNNMAIAYHFVLEEAAIMLLWCDAGYDFELHPSSRSPSLVFLHGIYYEGKDKKYLRQGRIKVLGGV